MRTNCDNCGAVIIDGKCEYCGSIWFVKQGDIIPEGAYIGEVSSTRHLVEICSGRTLDGTMIRGRQKGVWSLNLSIVGLTDTNIKDFMERLMEGTSK